MSLTSSAWQVRQRLLGLLLLLHRRGGHRLHEPRAAWHGLESGSKGYGGDRRECLEPLEAGSRLFLGPRA